MNTITFRRAAVIQCSIVGFAFLMQLVICLKRGTPLELDPTSAGFVVPFLFSQCAIILSLCVERAGRVIKNFKAQKAAQQKFLRRVAWYDLFLLETASLICSVLSPWLFQLTRDNYGWTEFLVHTGYGMIFCHVLLALCHFESLFLRGRR
jgi:hypothetical protein